MNSELRTPNSELRLVPLGDQAMLAYLPDESTALRFTAAIREGSFPWLYDVVPSYASVGVYFDADQIRLSEVQSILEGITIPAASEMTLGKLHRIPCCYEMQLDLHQVSEFTHLKPEEVIALHCGHEYTVYAIGFCPGFPYLGYLPEALQGVPRLPSPRVRVEAGSVGLTARQTGLYPLVRPGGWNLIGRTPLTIVNVEESYFPIRIGDRVCFDRIDKAEFERLLGERL